MKKHRFNTLTKEIFFNTFFITCFAIVATVIIIAVILCSQCRTKAVSSARYDAYVYAQDIKSLISESISRTNCIVNYTYIITGLDTTYTDVKSRVIFAEDIKSYLSHLMPAEINQDMVMIYTSNASIPNSRYISQISSLENYAQLQKLFPEENTNLLWSEKVMSAGSNQKYLQYYRTIAMNTDNIVASRIYLPKPQSNSIFVSAAAAKPPENTVCADINEYFYVYNTIDSGKIIREQIIVTLALSTLAIIIICLLYIISHILTHGITQDITNLIGSINSEVISEDSFRDLPSDYEEIKSIKRIVLNLIIKYNTSERERYKYALEKKHTELELMQRKIDSHTLYNSLSAIKLNAIKANDNKTIALVNSLVSYYRSILNNGLDIVDLKSELSMLENYVHINECSHGKSYNFEADADSAVLACRVPHLMLLPFVENSIMHGLAGKCKNCEIYISCRLKSDSLIISINDNGYGINDEIMDKLNDIEQTDVGYGIRNSYQRMKLFYGNNVSLHYEHRQPSGTRVVITVKNSPKLFSDS